MFKPAGKIFFYFFNTYDYFIFSTNFAAVFVLTSSRVAAGNNSFNVNCPSSNVKTASSVMIISTTLCAVNGSVHSGTILDVPSRSAWIRVMMSFFAPEARG